VFKGNQENISMRICREICAGISYLKWVCFKYKYNKGAFGNKLVGRKLYVWVVDDLYMYIELWDFDESVL
jgi:hypothetical protein